ncbi:hypothetical protein FKM82_023335 [Ascaphus truei]
MCTSSGGAACYSRYSKNIFHTFIYLLFWKQTQSLPSILCEKILNWMLCYAFWKLVRSKMTFYNVYLTPSSPVFPGVCCPGLPLKCEYCTV